MNKNPKYSIITINYNNASGLKLTVDSVINQTFTDYEFIVIDGGSNDSSVEIIKKNANKINHWVSEPDSGRYNAMNKGIKASTGEYLLFLNSGDYFTSNTVLEQVNSIDCNEKVFFGNILINENGEEKIISGPDSNLNLEYFLENALPHQATFFHKSVISQMGGYSEKYQIYADLELYLKIVKEGITLKHIPVTVSNYDLNGISSDNKYLLKRNNEKAQIFNEILGFPEVNFLTIVLNGMPFIQYHIEIFKNLPFKWHWHIVEGAAQLVKDTAWSVATGGKLVSKYHRDGLSIDGTSEYLDILKKEFPENITIYRKENGQLWEGKTEMVSAPLRNINKESLLWQIDADEVWTLDQFVKGRELFMLYPEKTAAYFMCNFFVGPDLVLQNYGSWGNNLTTEWLRVWRFKPGDRWLAHEPPSLMRLVNKQEVDLAKLNPFSHAHTESAGLVFQHYAYVIKSQIEFKEDYYGLKDLLIKWEKLNNTNNLPVYIKDYFPWVKEKAEVNTSNYSDVKPILRIDKSGSYKCEYNLDQTSPLITKQRFLLVNDLLNGNSIDLKITTLRNVNTEKELNKIYNSKIWRIVEIIQKVKLKIIPDNSLRRKLISKIIRIIKRQ